MVSYKSPTCSGFYYLLRLSKYAHSALRFVTNILSLVTILVFKRLSIDLLPNFKSESFKYLIISNQINRIMKKPIHFKIPSFIFCPNHLCFL